MNPVWGLPTSTEVCGKRYSICTDYRDILQIIDTLQDVDEDSTTKAIVAMALFYDDFDSIPVSEYDSAMSAMMDFIAVGEKGDGANHPKLIDWNQDAGIIASEINKVAGKEIRALEYLHWWSFIGYFQAIGEGQLSHVVSIREKLAKGKPLEKYEREYYHQNRQVVDFEHKLSTAEEETLNMWMGKG